MNRFNLIDEPWIPLRFRDGSRREAGIRDTLLRAKEIAAIEDPSPLVVAALHRFLLAVLYRSIQGPCDIKEARMIFRSGLPESSILTYLQQWKDRFWLFHESHPFGQNPHIPRKEIEPWSKLTPEFNATTNKVLFDHTDTRNPGTRTPGECARWLLATLQFSVSGGRGYFPSPSANGMMCIPVGDSLAATLCFNLVPYPNHEAMGKDTAIWERDPPGLPLEPPKRVPMGFADLYTWPSRMLLFEDDSGGGVGVTRFVTGLGCQTPNPLRDPMHPCRIDKDLGILPLRFDPGKHTWRNFDSLIPDTSALAPQTVEHAAHLTQGAPGTSPTAFLVLGLRNEPPNANLEFWRMELFQTPGPLASQEKLRQQCRILLDQAEATGKALAAACGSFARALISRGLRAPEAKDVKGAQSQMPCLPTYWAVLEAAFHGALQAFRAEQDFFAVERDWKQAIRRALQEAWAQQRMATQMGSAWTLRAMAKAEGPILAEFKRLDAAIQESNTYLAEEHS